MVLRALTALIMGGRVSKYRNRKATADGFTFDSKKERDRYCVLKLMERAGEIRNLEIQPRYDFKHDDKLICFYKADFRYIDNGVLVVEDVKGMKTRMYNLKKKMMKIFHGIEVLET